MPDFHPSVGGTTRQVSLEARELARRGHDVAVLTRRRSRSWPRAGDQDGFGVRRFGLPGRGRLAEKLALLPVAAWLVRRRGRILAVGTFQWTDGILAAALAGLLARTVVVWAARGDAGDALEGVAGRVRRPLYGRVRHVVLTEAMAAELVSLGLPAPTVVPVPIDLSHFRPPTPDERGDSRAGFGFADELVVTYVGHLRALKGVDQLVEAFAGLVRTTPARLLLVGGSRGAEDDAEPGLRDQVRRLGIAAEVTFAGVLSDPRAAYWASDVFVLPSTREGLPNTVLEAMACGVACVAPASAGGDDLLAGGAGLVPRSNDSDALIEALFELVDPELRTRLAASALERAAAYDVQTVTEALEAVLQRMTA